MLFCRSLNQKQSQTVPPPDLVAGLPEEIPQHPAGPDDPVYLGAVHELRQRPGRGGQLLGALDHVRPLVLLVLVSAGAGGSASVVVGARAVVVEAEVVLVTVAVEKENRRACWLFLLPILIEIPNL